jgi:anti-anti-sigma factor
LRAVLDGLALDKSVVIDMAGVAFMDSSGIHVLVERLGRLEDTGGSLQISNPSPAVRRVVRITRLDELLFQRADP